MEEISDNEQEHEIEELEKPKPKRVLSDAQREILKKGRETARLKREAKKAEEMPKPEVVEEVKPKRKYTKKVKVEPVPESIPEPVPEPVVKTRKPRALKVETKPEAVVETKPKVEELLEKLIEVSTKKTRKVPQDEAKPKTPRQKKTKEQTEQPQAPQWKAPKLVRPSVVFM